MPLQGTAEHVGAQGGGGDRHRQAAQVGDPLQSALAQDPITAQRFIEHKHHHRAALGNTNAEVHRFNGGELGDLSLTAQVGMHDVLWIGVDRQRELQALLPIQITGFGQGKELVAGPGAHRHRQLRHQRVAALKTGHSHRQGEPAHQAAAAAQHRKAGHQSRLLSHGLQEFS